ncbi:hypothetical protein KBC75_04815 [Candidatus Shapirobacteria bacterium]|nr:hypothetical protein [Candidatus Shapirobacteria bacterium]
MASQSTEIKNKVIQLRQSGHTYSEIIQKVNKKISKSTLSNWCHNINLSTLQKSRVDKINRQNLISARDKALKTNSVKRKIYLDKITTQNIPIAKSILKYDVGMIALAMLCLGEASKSKTKHKSFTLGSSDPRIITIFIKLLNRFTSFDPTKMRCTVQCRSDQNISELENYWQKVSQVPKKLFYPTRTDPRTKGKPTKNTDYKGVLVVDYYDRNIQLILESLANIVYNQLQIEGL